MKRLLALTMVAGMMSFGALAGQSTKPSNAPAAASASESPAAGSHAKHVKKHKEKKEKSSAGDGSVKPK